MFTALAIKNFAGSVLSFLWEYKGMLLLATILVILWIRGSHYQQNYEAEATAHVKTVLEYNQQINNIRLANEQALRNAQEESAAKYKELVEKTQSIQEKYNERNKNIDATITKLNSSNNSLQQTIAEYTKRNSNPDQGAFEYSSDATSLQLTGKLLGECIERKQYYSTEASKLQNSVITLQEWGDMVIQTVRGERGDVE